MSDNIKFDIATFANGCYWCTEAVFQRLKGVIDVQSGFSGGTVANPSYELVCTGTTGHAECLQIKFDPSIISYKELLEVFWKTHDPTTLNRQGNDVGTQYRSVIFFHNQKQRDEAENSLKELDDSGILDAPIVTAVQPCETFYPAPNYHNDYYNSHQSQPYCQLVTRPKVEKLKKYFADKLIEGA